MTACLFCAIATDQAPASVIHADARTVAFLDLRQPNPGHVLVIPRAHAATIFDLDDEVAAAVMQAAARIARALRAVLPMDGLTLWQSNGHAAGQEIDHFHLHLLPRAAGDRLLRVYPQGAPAPAAHEEIDALALRLRERLQGIGADI